MFEHGVVYRNEDSYCGPISMLATLPDEEVLLIFREAKWRGARTHSDPTTRASLIRSRDRGDTWFSQVTPDPTGGNGASIGRLSDGSLLANAFHWIFTPHEASDRQAEPAGATEKPTLDKPVASGGVYLVRSRTDGYTWEPTVPVPTPDGWASMSCAGAVIEIPGGDLLLPVTARTGEADSAHGALLRSKDKGCTWGEPVVITADAPGQPAFHETRLALCPSGRVLAMHRTKGNFFSNISTDGGRTWSGTADCGLWCGGSSPPDLAVLKDGRILLTQGYRRDPFGVRCRVSEDEGDSWGREIVLRDDAPDRDIGYPSTIEFDDESLLTVYYWHGDDQIRHLQRTRWRLAD